MTDTSWALIEDGRLAIAAAAVLLPLLTVAEASVLSRQIAETVPVHALGNLPDGDRFRLGVGDRARPSAIVRVDLARATAEREAMADRGR